MATPTVHPVGRLAPTAVGPTALLVGLLVCTDLFMMVLHLAHRSVQVRSRVPAVESAAFNISQDLGIAESFGYVKLCWIVLLLAWLGVLGRYRSYLPWALLYAYLLLDDMLGVHERGGLMLVRAAGEDPDRLLVAGLRVLDVGELAVAGSVGLVVLVPLAWGYLRGTARTKATYRCLLGATFVLAAFGLLADVLASAFGSHRGLQLLYLVEDGGELLAITIVLGYVLVLADRARNATSGDILPVDAPRESATMVS